METLFETDSLSRIEQAVSTAFFRGYGLFFTYYKVKGDLEEYERRTLEVISDLKYNDDGDILVCGCIDHEGNYRKFF